MQKLQRRGQVISANNGTWRVGPLLVGLFAAGCVIEPNPSPTDQSEPTVVTGGGAGGTGADQQTGGGAGGEATGAGTGDGYADVIQPPPIDAGTMADTSAAADAGEMMDATPGDIADGTVNGDGAAGADVQETDQDAGSDGSGAGGSD